MLNGCRIMKIATCTNSKEDIMVACCTASSSIRQITKTTYIIAQVIGLLLLGQD